MWILSWTVADQTSVRNLWDQTWQTRVQFPFLLPHSRGCCRKVEPLASDSPWNILLLRECFSFSSIRTGITLSKLLAVSEIWNVHSRVDRLDHIFLTSSHTPWATSPEIICSLWFLLPWTADSSWYADANQLCPLFRLPDWEGPEHNKLCYFNDDDWYISYLRNEAMIWWYLKPWLSKFCCDGHKRWRSCDKITPGDIWVGRGKC